MEEAKDSTKKKFRFSENKTVDTLIKVVGGLYIVAKIDDFIQEAKNKGAERKAATDQNVAHALGLRQAMNPSGHRWMFYFDTTNTKIIFRIAAEIQDLKAVEIEYENMFNKDSLLKDLESELSPEDMQKFLGLASKGKTGSKYYSDEKLKIPKGQYVLTTSKVNLRKTAKKYSNWSLHSNVIQVAQPHKILGLTTGKTVYDEEGDVLFIEVVTTTASLKPERRFFYVAKSEVELMTIEEKEKRAKITPYAFEILKGFDEVNDIFSGFDLVLVSKMPATIYNEQKQIVSKVQPKLILGFLIMRLDTMKDAWLQFKTVQGYVRWVKESEVKLIPKDE